MKRLMEKTSRFGALVILSLTSILLFTFVLIGLPSTHAEEQQTSDTAIRISPVTRRITLDPGSIATKDEAGDFAVTVTNTGKEAFDFSMVVEPYTVLDGTYQQISYDKQTNYTQISRWISFPQTEFKLEAGQSVSVPFTITVPEDVPTAGQYAVISAKTTGTEKTADGQMVHAIYQPSMIVFGHINGETREEAKVQSMEIKAFQPPKKVEGENSQPLTSNAIVRNSGNTDFDVKTSMTIKNVFNGEQIAKIDGGSRAVFPESERILDLSWVESPSIGIFTVQQDLEVLGKSYQISQVVVVVSPILVIVLAIIIVLVAVGIVVLVKFKRRKHPSRRGGGKKPRFEAKPDNI